MKVGILSREEYKKRTIAIAKGVYVPKKDEPKIWFESVKLLYQTLNKERSGCENFNYFSDCYDFWL